MHRLSEHDRAVLNSIFNPLLPLGEEESISEINQEGEADEDEKLPPEIAELQKRAIVETERKNYAEALKLFEAALIKFPNSAMILNDRAQCLRLSGRNEEAMRDLNLALESSKGRGRVGIRSLCQRGILLKINGRLDEARSDFSEAAKRGSKFARNQLVEINPYAAMCNQMLKEMTKIDKS